jgi:hypothetical protein
MVREFRIGGAELQLKDEMAHSKIESPYFVLSIPCWPRDSDLSALTCKQRNTIVGQKPDYESIFSVPPLYSSFKRDYSSVGKFTYSGVYFNCSPLLLYRYFTRVV